MTKILVVDDEANVQRLLQYTLKQAGYTVAVAGDGLEALKLWASEQPGLILLDVSLPKLDGYRVKPFHQAELLARMRGLLSRFTGSDGAARARPPMGKMIAFYGAKGGV